MQYSGPSLSGSTDGPDGFEPNTFQYFPLKILLQYIVVISVIIIYG